MSVARALPKNVAEALDVLERHYASFQIAVEVARKTDHPVPIDTRGWSQILVSALSGLKGLARKKGADFEDGSDVKAASTWEAIDTPRFNGVIKSGTLAKTAGTIESLDGMPFLFFVLWDHAPGRGHPRCRVWAVRTKLDKEFRGICGSWYDMRVKGTITSHNFQLHPPRGKDSNVFRNDCGSLEYPLLFCAEHHDGRYHVVEYHPEVLRSGVCKKPDSVGLFR